MHKLVRGDTTRVQAINISFKILLSSRASISKTIFYYLSQCTVPGDTYRLEMQSSHDLAAKCLLQLNHKGPENEKKPHID